MSKSWLDDWLSELEAQRSSAELDEHLLWPRTPIGDEIQDRIRERVGVSDLDVNDSRSRTARIVAQVRRLMDRGRLPDASGTVLDIACGDALILTAVRRAFPHLDVHGIDLHIGAFPAHRAAADAGVQLHRVLIQDLFGVVPPTPIDVVLMLNTYRGWENADLSKRDVNLPGEADAWLRRNARYIIVTATKAQLERWRADGFAVGDLGAGEERSRLACIARHRLPAGFPGAVRGRLGRATLG